MKSVPLMTVEEILEKITRSVRIRHEEFPAASDILEHLEAVVFFDIQPECTSPWRSTSIGAFRHLSLTRSSSRRIGLSADYF